MLKLCTSTRNKVDLWFSRKETYLNEFLSTWNNGQLDI